MSDTIEVLYTCHLCGLRDAAVKVPVRTTEDLKEWMDALTDAIAANHQQRSRDCRAQEISEVKIPASARDRVGGPIIL